MPALRVARTHRGRSRTLSAAALNGPAAGELGFTGVVISDALEMRAVSDLYGIPEAAVLAVRRDDLLCFGPGRRGGTVTSRCAGPRRGGGSGRLPAERWRSPAERGRLRTGWRGEPGEPEPDRLGVHVGWWRARAGAPTKNHHGAALARWPTRWWWNWRPRRTSRWGRPLPGPGCRPRASSASRPAGVSEAPSRQGGARPGRGPAADRGRPRRPTAIARAGGGQRADRGAPDTVVLEMGALDATRRRASGPTTARARAQRARPRRKSGAVR